MPTADVSCQKCKWNQWQLSSSASIDCDDERLAKASEGKGRQKMQLQTRMASHKKTTQSPLCRRVPGTGIDSDGTLGKVFRNLQHQINPLMNGTRLQTEQKGKGPAPLQGHDCCPALRSNAATSTNFVIVVHRNLQFCTPGDVAWILSCATPTQHARNTRVAWPRNIVFYSTLCPRDVKRWNFV